MRHLPVIWLAALCLMLAGAAVARADDDPPGRVARVNLIDGSGSIEPAGTDGWVPDVLNRPLTGGDKLWIDEGSRAEMHIGSIALRLGARTALQLLAVDYHGARLRLTAGSMSVRIRWLDPGDRFEIETPVGEFALLQPGGYRVDIDDRDGSARLAVWSGRASVQGPAGERVIGTDESVELSGGDDPAMQLADAGPTDSLDLWAEDRDHREDESRSAAYVSRAVVGYQDLDGYGDWIVDPYYGSLWVPQVVVAGWAPYRFGRWVWIGPWGWTWIDDAPWGFAPCHYGRWVYLRDRWAWAPGPRDWRRPVFAPALVAWRGDRYPRRDAGPGAAPDIGWVPLGYNEVYVPPYRASRDYLRAANLSNTRLRHIDVDRYEGRAPRGGGTAPERRYINERVPGAVTTVSRDAFMSAGRVGRDRARPVTAPDRPALRPGRSAFDRPVASRPPAAVDNERIRARPPDAGRGPRAGADSPPRAAESPQRPQILRDDRPAAAGIGRRIDRPVESAPPVRYAPPPTIRAPDGPTVERPVMNRPAIERPAIERPAIERPAIERPAIERPAPPQRYAPPPTSRAPEREAAPQRYAPLLQLRPAPAGANGESPPPRREPGERRMDRYRR